MELDQVKIGGSVPGATLVATDRATVTITKSVFKTMFAEMITAGISGARQIQLLIVASQVGGSNLLEMVLKHVFQR